MQRVTKDQNASIYIRNLSAPLFGKYGKTEPHEILLDRCIVLRFSLQSNVRESQSATLIFVNI